MAVGYFVNDAGFLAHDPIQTANASVFAKSTNFNVSNRGSGQALTMRGVQREIRENSEYERQHLASRLSRTWWL